MLFCDERSKGHPMSRLRGQSSEVILSTDLVLLRSAASIPGTEFAFCS